MEKLSLIPAMDGTRAQFAPILPEIPDNGKPTARLHFDSLGELAAMIPATAPHHGTLNNYDARDYWTQERKEFYGASMADALAMARNGWRDGAERARPLLERVQVARPTKRRLTRWSVAGAVPSVPRYLAGTPLSMRDMQRSPTAQNPILTLISSTAAPWFVKPERFEAAAIAAAAIVDRLEDAGFRVEVLVGRRESSESAGARNGTGENNKLGHRSEVWCRVKAAQDTLDLDRLAFGIGHPSVHRRLFFAVGEMHPAYKASLQGCQGYAVGLDNLEMPAGTYSLPSLASAERDKIDGPIAVFDAAIAALKAQGCPGLDD